MNSRSLPVILTLTLLLSISVTAGAQITLPKSICVPPPPSLVSWWPGDEDYNDIISGNNGSPGVAFTLGEVAPAFAFNGINDSMAIGNPENLRITGPLTVDAWIKPNQTSTYQAIFSQMSTNLNLGEVEFRINGPGGNLNYTPGTIGWFRRSTGGSIYADAVTTTTILTPGQ